MQSLCFGQCVRRLWTPAQTHLLLKLGNIQKFGNCRLQHNKVMCILNFRILSEAIIKVKVFTTLRQKGGHRASKHYIILRLNPFLKNLTLCKMCL